jgi:hypothetical protein
MVNYGHDWTENGSGMLLSTTAQFVQYAAMNQDQLSRVLALPLDPTHDLPPLEKCGFYKLNEDLSQSFVEETDEEGRVELVEAGTLMIQTPSHSLTLTPKHLPGLLPFISGVLYSEAQTLSVEQIGKVKATSTGGENIGSFSAQMSSPTLPRLIRIAGLEPGQRIPFSRRSPLSLQWQAQANDPNDVTYIELRYRNGTQEMALRCHPQDDGVFEIPREYLPPLSGGVILDVGRIRRTEFLAPGLEEGELRVTVRDTARLQ